MIEGLKAPLQDPQRPSGIDRSACERFEERLLGYMMGAGACHQDSPGRKQPQRAAIDFAIGIQGLIERPPVLGEGRRIEHDRIEAAAGRGITGEQIEHVCLPKLDVFDRVFPGVVAGSLDCGRARIHQFH